MTHKKLTVHTELLDGTLDGARDIYMGLTQPAIFMWCLEIIFRWFLP